MNRTYDTNYILNDIYIHGDGTVRLRRFDNNFIFNAIFDPTLPGLRVNKIVDMPSTELTDMPQTLVVNKYLVVNSTATGYELANIDGGNPTTPYYGHLGAAVGTNNYIQKVIDKATNTLGDSQIYDNGTNVGIGTASPEHKLDISVSAINTPAFSVYDGFYRYNIGVGSRGTAGPNGNYLDINKQSSNTIFNNFGGAGGFKFQYGGTDKVIISTGGTTAAPAKLQVNGSVDIWSGATGLIIGGENGLTTRTAGQSMVARIVVPTPVAGLNQMLLFSTGSYIAYGGGSSVTSPAAAIGFYVGTPDVAGAGVEKMRITPTGIGIGTTAPAYNLDVKGTTTTSGIRSDIGYDIYPVLAPTINPTFTITTGAGLEIGQYYYAISYYTAIGETNLKVEINGGITTAGNQQITLTNIPISSDYRVIGKRIYRGKVGQAYNCYLVATLANDTTTYIDAIPDAALGTTNKYYQINTTSSMISINGVRSMILDKNTTAFGFSSGRMITTGGRNTLFGSGAGSNITSGAANILIGHSAGSSITSGGGNICLGEYTCRGAANSSNICIGPYTGYSGVTSLFGNILIGTLAGYKLNNSDNNVFIGRESGLNSVTCSYSIFIGNNSGKYETGSNKLIIDSIDRTSEALGRTSALLYGVFSSTPANQILSLGGGGNVGIGTTAPASKLQVIGETRLGSATDYTKFEQDGTMEAVGAATCWEDLRVEPTVRGTGANNPSFEQYFTNGAGSRGVYLYSFDDAVTNSEKEVFFTMQMPHAWAGTAISLHVHWIGNLDDTAAAPIWGLEYTWADIGTVFGNSGIVYTDGKNYTGSGDDADIVAFKHYLSEFADITPTTSQDGISSILIGRLFRRSGDASDTYNVANNKCGLLYIDAHYEVNTLGSRAEYSK